MCSSLRSLRIPSSVSSIGERAFYNCTSLSSVHLPDCLLSAINSNTFCECTGLSSIHLPESLSTIGEGAFSWCTNLNSLHLPDSLVTIDSNAFYRCTSLSTVYLPDSLSTIGCAAFYRCTSLLSICIPESLSAVAFGAFQGCTALNNIQLPPSFTRTAIDNRPDSWREALPGAKFYPIKLSRVLNGDPVPSQYAVYYDWKRCAKNLDAYSGRFPLSVAAEQSIGWSSGGGWLRNIFLAHMPAIEVCDRVTGLEPFMLAAVWGNSDLEAVYELLRRYPAAIYRSGIR